MIITKFAFTKCKIKVSETDITAVTPSKRSSINTYIIGSPLRAFESAQDEHRALSLIPLREGGGVKTQSLQIRTISYDNSEMLRNRMSVTINH